MLGGLQGNAIGHIVDRNIDRAGVGVGNRGGGHHPAIDHQEFEPVALNHLFHGHIGRDHDRRRKRGLDLFTGRERRTDSWPSVTILRLDDDGETKRLGLFPGRLGRVNPFSLGHRNAERLQQGAVNGPVIGNFFSHRRRGFGGRAVDPSHLFALPHHQQAQFPHLHARNSAGPGGCLQGPGGGVENGCGADRRSNSGHGRRNIKAGIGIGGLDQNQGLVHRGPRQLKIIAPDHHPVNPLCVVHGPGPAIAHIGTGQGLQLQRDMLQNMRGVRAIP